MNDFLTTALTLPTLPYSVLLAVCTVYWALAATGLVDLDGADVATADGDASDPSGIAAVLARLGIAGVPIMLVLTVLAIIGWAGTYYVHLLLLQPLPAGLRIGLGLLVAIGMLAPGLLATSMLLRPVSRLVLRLRPPAEPSLLGRVAIVSSPSVDAGHGQATIADVGAGLILQVRSLDAQAPRRGDRVVLVEYLAAQHAWRVVPEATFNSL